MTNNSHIVSDYSGPPHWINSISSWDTSFLLYFWGKVCLISAVSGGPWCISQSGDLLPLECCEGEGNDNPLQYSCLENPTDGGAWWAAVHGVTKSRTQWSDFPFTFHFHLLEKEMATHSSVLAWRIPGTGEPGGLPSMGSHRVGHDWSDWAAAAECCEIEEVWDGSPADLRTSDTFGLGCLFCQGTLLTESVAWLPKRTCWQTPSCCPPWPPRRGNFRGAGEPQL